MSRSDGSPRFLVDRNLGAVKVPGLLRQAGFEVVTLQERYGVARAAVVTDVEWLTDAGERGDFVLMRDTRIRRNPLERRALVEARVGAFCLARGHTTATEQAALFVAHRDRIVAATRDCPPPFLYVISGEGFRRVL